MSSIICLSPICVKCVKYNLPVPIVVPIVVVVQSATFSVLRMQTVEECVAGILQFGIDAHPLEEGGRGGTGARGAYGGD